jgi:hypothetical protein
VKSMYFRHAVKITADLSVKSYELK